MDEPIVENAGSAPYTTACLGCGRGSGDRFAEVEGTQQETDMSSVLAVMLAETLPDRETERLLLELEKLKAPVAEMFVNRILLSGDLGRCGRCL